jgi:LysM repeat protein
MTYSRFIKILIALSLGLGMIALNNQPASVLAQDNLLKDPGFENGAFNVVADRTGTEGVLCTVPADWGGWFTETPRTADWQNRVPTCTGNSDKANSFVRSGNRSHEFSRGDATFTAAIYQTVSVPAVGTNVVGQAYYVMEVGTGSTAQVRVGIDPNGGTNPFDSDVVWSNWGSVRRNTDGFGPLTVNATSTGTSVTLFIYVTQATPTNPNKVFIDDASLVIGGPGGGVAPQPGTPGAPPTATPPPVLVANFVVPQGTQEDGSIIHTVVEGDTLAAIATAYRVSIDTLRELNPEIGRGSFLFIGQRILVRPAQSMTNTPRPSATPNLGSAVTATPSGNTNQTSATNTPAPTLTTRPPTQGNLIFATATPRNNTSTSSIQPTATATDAAITTQEPTATEAVVATEIVPPTATIAPTNTDLPPAPVVEPTAVAMNPQTVVTGVCSTFFDDLNRNRIADIGETPLVGGIITLRSKGQDVSSYLTTGDPEPYCFDNLTPDDYVVFVTPPQGYGMTTPMELQVKVQAGSQVTVAFGAAQGVVAPTPVIEQPAQPAIVEQPAITQTTADDDNNSLLANIGIIILGLAGFTLITGIIGTILISRRG